MPIKPSDSSKPLLNTARVTLCTGRAVKVDVILFVTSFLVGSGLLNKVESVNFFENQK